MTLSSNPTKCAVPYWVWDPKPWWLQTALNNPHPHILFFMIFLQQIRIFLLLVISINYSYSVANSLPNTKYCRIAKNDRIVQNNEYRSEYSYIPSNKCTKICSVSNKICDFRSLSWRSLVVPLINLSLKIKHHIWLLQKWKMKILKHNIYSSIN